MNIQLIRHATLLITVNGRRILVDPMLAEAGSMPPIPKTANQVPNPTATLPACFDLQQLQELDAVLITHTHVDHFDERAAQLLPKGLPVFCQTEDVQKLQEAGFTDVRPVAESVVWENITMHRTNGQHGTGEIGKMMGTVSGFVLKTDGEPSLYIAGDTIWCSDVQEALDAYRPDITVLFAGGAQFLKGGPITMTKEDVGQVCLHAPYTRVLPVHLEAINHCGLTREELRGYLEEKGLESQVQILQDGESAL